MTMDQQRAVAAGGAVHSTAVVGAAEESFAGVSVPGVWSWDRLCQCARIGRTCNKHQGVAPGQGPWAFPVLRMSCRFQVSKLELKKKRRQVEWGPVDEAGSTVLGREGWGEANMLAELLVCPTSSCGDGDRRS